MKPRLSTGLQRGDGVARAGRSHASYATHWGLLLATVISTFGAAADEVPFRGVLVRPDQIDVPALKTQGYGAVALRIDGLETLEEAARTATDVRGAGRALFYWFEVARDPALAEIHPEWMASLQTHQQWRRHFPSATEVGPGEVVKTHPWVPIAFEGAFAAHLSRIAACLRSLPAPDGVFLNDLQAGPSACGCGNLLCRWTPEYGPISTAARSGPEAASRFVVEVQRLVPDGEVIPVWMTECEEHESRPGGDCGGVGCYSGRCWWAWTEQLMALAGRTGRLAVPALPRAWAKAPAPAGGGFVSRALAAFERMPPERGGRAVSSDRLIAVLQGWDSGAATIQADVEEALAAGAAGYLLALTPIEQSWSPRVVRLEELSGSREPGR